EPKIGRPRAHQLHAALHDVYPSQRKWAESQIITLARVLLSETYRQEKILLVPPKAMDVAGPIEVGDVCFDGPRGKLGLERSEFLTHVGLVGASGTGKSTLAMQLVARISKDGVPVVVFDNKRTWRSILDRVPNAQIYTLARPNISPLHFNPLIPPREVPA